MVVERVCCHRHTRDDSCHCAAQPQARSSFDPTRRTLSSFARSRHWKSRRVAAITRVLFVLLLLLGGACRHKQKENGSGSVVPTTVQLTDQTKEILLTWIDDTGDFHVTESMTDIKDANRQHVRVVFTNSDTVDPDHVWVADLRQKDAKGAYPIQSMARSAWEEMGASHRKSRLEAMAAPIPTSDAGAQSGEVTAVIYGAEWCKACHEMAHYLKTKGVKYEEKDVDKSSVVQAELQSKFAKAHVPPSSSIPVTDIGGRLIVGFNPQAVDAALAALSGGNSRQTP